MQEDCGQQRDAVSFRSGDYGFGVKGGRSVTLPTIDERLAALLKNVGQFGAKCSACEAPIAWVKHANGKMVPYDASPDSYGVNHFVTCPARERFKARVQ